MTGAYKQSQTVEWENLVAEKTIVRTYFSEVDGREVHVK